MIPSDWDDCPWTRTVIVVVKSRNCWILSGNIFGLAEDDEEMKIFDRLLSSRRSGTKAGAKDEKKVFRSRRDDERNDEDGDKKKKKKQKMCGRD